MNLYGHYRTELKRIAWRLQYYVRKEQGNETLSALDIVVPVEDFSYQSMGNIIVQELLRHLPSEVGREIIHQIYILGKTEKEVSVSLNMSQQGVHKWKNKMLNKLRKMSSYVSYWNE